MWVSFWGEEKQWQILWPNINVNRQFYERLGHASMVMVMLASLLLITFKLFSERLSFYFNHKIWADGWGLLFGAFLKMSVFTPSLGVSPLCLGVFACVADRVPPSPSQLLGLSSLRCPLGPWQQVGSPGRKFRKCWSLPPSPDSVILNSMEKHHHHHHCWSLMARFF